MNDTIDTRHGPQLPHDPSGDDTCEALLAAARELFAQRGYRGASIRAITGRAGANLGAVTYHFGSKESLYHEVLRRALAPLRARVEGALEGPGSVLDRVDAVIRAYLDHLHESPDLPLFLLQQIAAGQAPPPPVSEVMQAISGRLAGLVMEGQRSGEIREGDPLLLVLSLLAQPIYFTLIRHPIKQIVGLDLHEPGTRSALEAHVLAFARAGLTPDPS